MAQLNSTVLGTGILPTVMKTGENTDIDVSAFSGSLKSQTATITCIVHPFTDAMTIKRVNASTGRSHNQPGNLKPSDLPQYGNLFMEGFSATYQAILDKLSDLTKYSETVVVFAFVASCVQRDLIPCFFPKCVSLVVCIVVYLSLIHI